jgi:hypothetical protein
VRNRLAGYNDPGDRQGHDGRGDGDELGGSVPPLRDQRCTRSPSFCAMIRKPSCLSSWIHSGPVGTFRERTGLHGQMKPGGWRRSRARGERINIPPPYQGRLGPAVRRARAHGPEFSARNYPFPVAPRHAGRSKPHASYTFRKNGSSASRELAGGSYLPSATTSSERRFIKQDPVVISFAGVHSIGVGAPEPHQS